MKQKAAIIVPAFNEGTVIKSTLTEVLQACPVVICVDDGSSDNTAKEVLSTNATLVQHPINMGAGAATQTGVEFALQDENVQYFVTFDGDGQHRVEDIAPLLKHLQDNKLDVVFGSRFLGKVENIKGIKAVFLKVVKLFNKLTTRVELTDPHIGLRVFNRKFAESLDITLHGFAHASEIVEHIGEGDFKYGEYPVTVIYTDYSLKKGQPMLNAVNIIFDLFFNKVIKK
jgi:glycosyltransferase involved in cell wall biosynthesis